MDHIYHFWLYRINKKIFDNIRAFEESTILIDGKLDKKYLDIVSIIIL